MTNNSGAMSFGDIIENNSFRIPMYQRAYKWEEKQCKKLLLDLINAYKNKSKKSLGLITLHYNQDNTFDVIDGQQRFLTLSIISSLLGSYELTDKIIFERDEDDERKNVLKELSDSNKSTGFTDGDRIVRNAKSIFEDISRVKNKKEFWEYIKQNCLLLCGTVSNNAIEEFMNLNAYKTPFSICDHVRSNLITLNTFHKEELQKNEELLAPALSEYSYKTAVAKLYDEIIRILYVPINNLEGTYKSVYEVVSKNCRKVKACNESRINIIFTELLKGLDYSLNGYRCNDLNQEFDGWLKELIWIAYLKNLLLQLQDEMRRSNFSSAKLIDDYCNSKEKPSFFSLITKDVKIDQQTSNDLARILDKKSTIDNVIFGSFKPDEIKKPNLFLEALCTAQRNQSTEKSYYNVIKPNCLDLKLDESVVDICIQSTGKYIVRRFLEEQQRSNDSYFQVAPIMDFEDKENPRFIQFDSVNDVWSVAELFKENIFIPVIQRDYCMGSSILHEKPKNDSNEDFLGFIIKSFNDDNPAMASTIVIAIDEHNNRYIFDGQQRTYTIYQLLKFFGAGSLKDYKFVGRDEVSQDIIKPKTYIEESIQNLHRAIENRCKDLDTVKFIRFIEENIKFNVKVISEVSAAEQFFMDINGGVPLENYEIFKSCLINSINDDEVRKSFVKKLENKWLNFFYLCKNKIYEGSRLANSNHSEEELIEMRFIEYLVRWLYKNLGLESRLPDSFDIISSKSDLVQSTNYLREIDFKQVIDIIDNIIWKVVDAGEDFTFTKHFNGVKFCKSNFQTNSTEGRTIVGYAHLTDNFDISNLENFFIERFIRSFSIIGRKSYFMERHKEAINYYESDLIMNTILNRINGSSNNSELEKYTNSRLHIPIHLIAGYSNWSSKNITSCYEKLTKEELPIYYIDDFFNNNNIYAYCNLYRSYNNSLSKNIEYEKNVRKTEGSIFLFLVLPPSKTEKIKLDTGAIYINGFSIIKQYTNGCDFVLTKKQGESNVRYQCFLNQRSAYSIRLNNNESSIMDKKDDFL